MQTQTYSSARRASSKRHASPTVSPSAAAAQELRAWLAVVDAALRVVEQTAWETRRLAAEWAEAAKADILHVQDRRGELAKLQARLVRATQCGWVLAKIASSYRWHLTRAAFTTRASAAAALARLHAKNADRFRDLCIAQGGAFLKVGQLLSARPDLLPSVWVDSLSCLQDAAPPVPIDEILEVLERELGAPVGELFLSFEEESLAAASIGQVHRATLLDGRQVAVKVQRPGVDELVELDMDLLAMFLDGMKSMLPPTDYDTIVGEVRKLIREELDYERERAHTARAAAFFADDPRISVPRPVDTHSSARVLTTEMAAGEKFTTALDRLRQVALDSEHPGAEDATREIADSLGLLLQAYVRQILVAGHFQADPHPGNLLYDTDAGLTLLDFGCSKSLDEPTRAAYLKLVQSFVVSDRESLVAQLEALGFRTRSGSPDTLLVFADTLLKEFRDAQASGGSLRFRRPEDMIAEAKHIMDVATADPVDRIPEEFVMIARVFGTIGGLFTHYEPEIDFSRHVMPTLMTAMTAMTTRTATPATTAMSAGPSAQA